MKQFDIQPARMTSAEVAWYIGPRRSKSWFNEKLKNWPKPWPSFPEPDCVEGVYLKVQIDAWLANLYGIAPAETYSSSDLDNEFSAT